MLASNHLIGFGAVAASSDGNDSFTKVLLHMEGSNGGTTFTDDNLGGSAHTWTATTATTSTTTAKFGSTSESCGSTGWIDTPDSTDFTLGSSDFTIDFWFYRSGGDGARRTMAGQSNSSASSFAWAIELSASNVVNVYFNNGGTLVTGTTAFTTTGWNHVALVRTGNTLKLFVNGTQEGGDVAFSGSCLDSANKLAVGRLGEYTSLTWNGYIDEFRMSVGVARWTANFTPPTVAYS